MEFVNHTPFPAQNFAGIDQHDQEFHVLVLRQTLTWDDEKLLVYADEQAPLCEEDRASEDPSIRGLLQESDYCQYKPHCDVIVNATAYAPQGKPVPRFGVRVVLRRPDESTPLPPRPQGLNPFMAPSDNQLEEWRHQVEQRSCLPGQRLVDKQLEITGERSFVRRAIPLRMLWTLLRVASMGVIRLPAWRLTRPTPTTKVPVLKDLAFGGSCLIRETDKAADRIRRENKLTSEQKASQPAGDGSLLLAAAAFEANPAGSGFVEQWYVRAMQLREIRAPQIEHSSARVTASHLELCLNRKLSEEVGLALVAGFGVRPKCHPSRRKFAGTADEAFAKSSAWLPQDFDFAVWNAAEADQQTEFLRGDETLELTNLCAPDAHGAIVDAVGNTVLELALPANECHVLVRLESGEMFVHPMVIDTLVAEPESRRLSLVWRLVLANEQNTPIRTVEARMYSFAERDRMREEIDDIKTEMQASYSNMGGAGKGADGDWHA